MTNQLTTIKLYGALGRKFGRVHHMAVGSVAEAVRAMGSQIRGFDAYLTQAKDNGMAFTVFYGKRNLAEDELKDPCMGEEIRIAPVLLGSKNGGIFNIILGAVLVIVGGFVSVASFGGAAPLGAAMINVGWGLIVGGVVQLLTPAPKGMSARDKPDNQPSYTFNGAINTQAQGNPVQVLYGELIIGSAVLSAGISAVDQAYVPRTTPGAGSGGGGGGGAPPWHLEWASEL